MAKYFDLPLHKALALAVTGGLVLEGSFYAIRYLVRVFKQEEQITRKCAQKPESDVVLFFPDPKPSCIRHFSHRHGCTFQQCRFSHNEDYSFGKVIRMIDSARQSLDVAVFCITSPELADLIINLHDKGVSVRVMTDDEQIDQANSQIGKFRAAGIQVRHDRSSFYMHHKFVVVDGKTLINGSFNWTRNAVTGNQENVFITHHTAVVEQYIEEYERLWEQFNPTNYL